MEPNKHIFRVGDKVKVVRTGWGIAFEDHGKITTITSLQECDSHGEPLYGVDQSFLSYTNYNEESQMRISERSFVLVEPVKVEPGPGHFEFVTGNFVSSFNPASASDQLIKGDKIVVGYFNRTLGYTSLPPLYAVHKGESEIEIIDSFNWDEYKRTNSLKDDPFEMKVLKSAIKTTLESAIREYHSTKWPLEIGNVTVYVGGSVYVNNLYAGRILKEFPEQGKRVLFASELDKKFAFTSVTLGNIKKAVEKMTELEAKKLWIPLSQK